MPIEFSIGRDKGDKPRSAFSPRTLGIGGVVLVIAVVLLEQFVLHGEVVFKESVRGIASPLVRTLRIERIGEKHLLEIYTREKSELKVLIQNPSGETVHEVDEMVRHKRRYVSITPKVAGDYKLTVERDMLVGTGRIRGRIELLVNDRRIFAPLLYAIGL